MKEILFTAIALFAMVLFALIYPIVCLIKHFKANTMSLKERVKSTEANVEKYSRSFIIR